MVFKAFALFDIFDLPKSRLKCQCYTLVGCRFWLIDYVKPASDETSSDELITLASKIYSEAVAVPVLARFVVFTRSHHATEAQLRVLCITEDFDVTTTLECQEQFHEIVRSEPVQVCMWLCTAEF